MKFEFELPTSIYFGSGVFDQLHLHVQKFGSKALLVGGKSMHTQGWKKKIQFQLAQADVQLVREVVVKKDPTHEEVDQIIAIARHEPVDCIIAIGGGSVLDAGKAASVLHQESSSGPWVGKSAPTSYPKIPLIAMPTTAGTGSEVTKGAIITDLARRFKSGIRGHSLYPNIALVDPDLIASMPAHVKNETVFDAFTHLFETLITRKSSPLNHSLSMQGLGYLARCLKRERLSLADGELREYLSLAALMGGINIGSAGSCLPHRLQQAMGSIKTVECSHGRGLSSVYRAWIRRVYNFARPQIDQVLEVFEQNSVDSLIAHVQATLDMPVSLREVGYQRDMIEVFCQSVSGALENDPIDEVTPEVIREIYLDAF